MFILGEGPDCTSSQVIVTNILGTSFAVSSRHVLTAYHNLCDVDAITPMYDVNGVALVGKYLIARSGTKVGSDIALISPWEVKLVKFDLTYDWAVLELVDSSTQFPAWLSLCEKSELPSLDTQVVDVKTLFAPVGQFLINDIRDLKIWPDEYRRILQYDDNETQLIVDGGLYRGSCGSPYLDHRGKVVAIHLSSFHEGRNLSLVKPTLGKRRIAASTSALTSAMNDVIDQVTNLSDVHNSTRSGVVLANVPDILDYVKSLSN